MDVIIDTDPGIDDAMALMLALRSKELNVKAISTTYGNVSVSQAVRNTLTVLEILSCRNSPVIIKGAAGPMHRMRLKKDPRVHGKNGLADAKVPSLHVKPAIHNKIGILAKMTDAATLICLGPLTNLAELIFKYPSSVLGLKRVIIMGGALTVAGNITEFAEHNIYCDPEAAKIVFESGLDITMVGLDVTKKAILTEDDLKNMNLCDVRLRFINSIAVHYMDFYRKYRRVNGCFLHDPLAVAVAIDPGVVKTRKAAVGVRTSGIKRGQIFAKKGSGPNINVCLDLDKDRFMELFRSRVLS